MDNLDSLMNKLPSNSTPYLTEVSGADNFYYDRASAKYLYKLTIYNGTTVKYIGFINHTQLVTHVSEGVYEACVKEWFNQISS